MAHPSPQEEERVPVALSEGEEGPAAGSIHVRSLSAPHVLVLADILAKSVALGALRARDRGGVRHDRAGGAHAGHHRPHPDRAQIADPAHRAWRS
ncbi:MAG: hypothetical protein WDN03_00540 [Rhizomicrobium sp.]